MEAVSLKLCYFLADVSDRVRGRGLDGLMHSVATMEVIGRFRCWVEILNCDIELDTVFVILLKIVSSSLFSR